jgi:hypothetical protein
MEIREGLARVAQLNLMEGATVMEKKVKGKEVIYQFIAFCCCNEILYGNIWDEWFNSEGIPLFLKYAKKRGIKYHLPTPKKVNRGKR